MQARRPHEHMPHAPIMVIDRINFRYSNLINPCPLNLRNGDPWSRPDRDERCGTLSLIFGVTAWAEERCVAVEEAFPRVASNMD